MERTILKQKGLLFLDKNLLYLYTENMFSPIRLDFSPTIVKDLEVLDLDEFTNKITSFIEQYRIDPAQLVIILSPSVYFEKEIVNPPGNQQEAEIQSFLDNVPFENVTSKLFQEEKGYLIIAVNGDLYAVFKKVFEKRGFFIEAVVPDFMATEQRGAVQVFDLQVAKSILKKFDTLKELSIDILYVPEEKTEEGESERAFKIGKKAALPILVTIFILLVAIFLFLLVKQIFTP